MPTVEVKDTEAKKHKRAHTIDDLEEAKVAAKEKKQEHEVTDDDIENPLLLLLSHKGIISRIEAWVLKELL